MNHRNFPTARLTDFGLANIVDSNVLKVKGYIVKNKKGTTLNYCGPDRLIAQFPRVSSLHAKMADLYSFSMVMYALISGKEPWD